MAGIGRLDISLGLDAAEYTEGLSRAEQQAARFGKQIESQIGALRKQVENLGFSERQIKIYELAQKGATREQLLSVDALYKQKEAFLAAGKATAAAAAAAAKQKANSEGIDKQVKALQDQVAVQGKSAGAAKLYALAQQGANKSQLEAADAALRQQAAYEAGIKIGNALRTTILAIGAAAATAATVAAAMFVKIVGSLDDLDEAAQAVGTSATALAEYRRAASESGVEAEKFDTALTKLNVKLVDAAGGGKESAATFKAMGIEIRNSSGQIKTTDELLAEVADKFATYRDGAEKTALAVELFGRAGARMIPFLNQGSEGLRKLTAVSEEGVKAARELQAQFDTLKGSAEDFATSIAVKLIPFITKMIQEFNAATSAAGSFGGALKLLLSQSADTLADPGAKIEDIRKKLEGLRATKPMSLGDFIKFGSSEGRDKFNATAVADAQKELKFLQEIQRNRALVNFAAPYSNEGRAATKAAPVVPRVGSAGTDKALQLAKKELDEQLSQLDNFIKAEARLLEARNASLDRLYDLDRISISEYFSAKSAALDKATFETADIYREQIDNLKRFYNDTKDQTLKLAALKEIGVKTEKQAEFLSDASRKATKLQDDTTKAAEAYRAKVEEVRLKVLELSDAQANSAEIAGRRFDAANAGFNADAFREKDTESQKNQALLRQRVVDQATVNDLLSQSQVIQQNLATAEGRINLERELGLRSELEGYNALGSARAQSVAQLQQMADAYKAMAEKFKDPAMLAQAKAMQLSIDAMAASVDVLGNRIRTEFKESFNSAFEGLLNDLNEGKNALDSFKDFFKNFANDIIRNVNRIAAQSVTDALFKSNGAQGGGGYGTQLLNFFGSLFGGQDLSGAGTTLYASGTDFVPRDGMAYLHRGERVVTAADNKGGRWSKGDTNISISVPGGTNAATANQIAAAVSRQMAISNARYN